MLNYDVIIIGAGFGGLMCGATLSKEGMKVCVLEKNPVIGGCLQSFRRRGVILDTGVHYVGSMDEGKFLNMYFQYCGIASRLNLQRLDGDAFEEICIDGKRYTYGMGYESFRTSLSEQFPKEKAAIDRYCHMLQDIGSVIHTDHLKSGVISASGIDHMGVSASRYIEELTSNRDLQNLLSAGTMLYGGIRDVSSLYHHAMINSSNLDGSYRFVDGTQQLADVLADEIRMNGGCVLTRSEVTSLSVSDGKITSVEVNGDRHYTARKIISNIHPANTFRLVEKTALIKKAFKTRIESLQNSYGMFTTYLLVKPDTIKFVNRNFYQYENQDLWDVKDGSDTDMRTALFLSMQPAKDSPDFARVITLLTPMNIGALAPWLDTSVGKRGETYEAFKLAQADQMIQAASRILPGLQQCIEQVYTASPLTYRDYTGTPEGSAYGILKNCQNPLLTLMPIRSKIENLLLTGQNVNVHGLVGCGVTAALTCSELLGMRYLAHKIGRI